MKESELRQVFRDILLQRAGGFAWSSVGAALQHVCDADGNELIKEN